MSARLQRWLYCPSDGRRIAAFRVAFSVYLLGYLAALLPNLPVMISSEGVYTPYLVPDLAAPPSLAWALYGAMLLLAATLLVGWRSNASAGLLLLLYGYHYFVYFAVKQSAFERLILIYLAVLALADAGRVWGLDGSRLQPARPMTAWAERLIAFQSVALYFGAALWKIANPRWHTGAMLYATLQGMFSTPLSFWIVRLGAPAWLWTAATFGVIVLELLLAAGLVYRRTRPTAIILGTLFHLANAIILDIPEFLIGVAAYAVFLETGVLQSLEARFRRRDAPSGPGA